MSRPAATRATSSAERRSLGFSARRAALLPFLLLILVGILPSGASAHAQLESLDPADGARLATPPAAVTLTFNEPIGLATGGLQVLDSTGIEVGVGEDVVSGPTVSQALPRLPDGWYLVIWGIVSEDGHIVRASSVFGVGDADAAARPAAASDDRSAVTGVARFLGDLGLLVAAGAWAAWWLMRARLPSVRRLAGWATALALAGALAWAIIEWLDGGSAWLATPAATLTIVRLLLLAIGLLAGAASAVRGPIIAAGTTALALVTLAGGGHSSGDPFDVALLSTHLAAAVVWLGAAPALLLTLRDRSLADEEATGVARRFSRLAGFALVGVGVAGAALTWNLSDGLAGGLTTPWVLVLAAKVALVASAALLGAVGRRHLGRTPTRTRLAGLFLIDAVLLTGIAALSATLTLTSPHTGHTGHEGHDVVGSSRCAAEVGDSSVSVIVTPARVGSNEVTIGGVPRGALSVTLSWVHELTQGGALKMEGEPSGSGWTTSGVLPLAGSWEVTVAVRVDTFTQVNGTCRLPVEP